jgi:hypothetical protein
MQLNLPSYEVNIRESAEKGREIYDDFRKKFVKLTPEEWVRQHFLHFLVSEKHYPPSLIGVEKGLLVNGMPKRFDAVVFKNDSKPAVLIEFKAPTVMLKQTVLDQIASYNLKLHASYLMVSNGLKSYCCKMDYQNQSYSFLDKLPDFNNL